MFEKKYITSNALWFISIRQQNCNKNFSSKTSFLELMRIFSNSISFKLHSKLSDFSSKPNASCPISFNFSFFGVSNCFSCCCFSWCRCWSNTWVSVWWMRKIGNSFWRWINKYEKRFFFVGNKLPYSWNVSHFIYLYM